MDTLGYVNLYKDIKKELGQAENIDNVDSLSKRVFEELSILSLREVECVNMYYIRGWTKTAIATRLGVTSTTIGVNIRNAIKKLSRQRIVRRMEGLEDRNARIRYCDDISNLDVPVRYIASMGFAGIRTIGDVIHAGFDSICGIRQMSSKSAKIVFDAIENEKLV